jgi:hypothetical protein
VLTCRSYEQFSLGRDIATEVRLNPLVVDMLISFAVSCLKGTSSR